MATAIPIGLLLGVGVGTLTVVVDSSPSAKPLLTAAVVAFATAWGLIGLVWVVVVDRTTLTGAINDPDESIESAWLDTAMAGAFRDTIMLTGLALGVTSLGDIDVDGTWALVGVLLVAFGCTAIRYLMARKRG